jgi:putative membrane protein
MAPVQEDISMDKLAFAQPVLAHAGPYHGGPGFGGFLMFLIWIAIIFFVVRFFVLRGGPPWRDGPRSADRASDILAERYARGEIDSEEFQARDQTLRDRRSQEPSPLTRARGMVATRSVHTILAERYARGEIDAEEYRERLRNLES